MPISKNTKSSNTSHQVSMMPSASSNAPSAEGMTPGGPPGNTGGTRPPLLTRRNFLYGAAAVGAVAAAAVGAAVVGGSDEGEDEIATLEVAEADVFTLDDCTEIAANAAFKLIGDFTLPYGSLIWANEDTMAACLLPTDTPSPLTQMALLNLITGEYASVLEQAVGTAEGFEIYDVRATSSGMVWTEANIFENRWRIYGARLDDSFVLGEPALLDQGGQDTETPSIAATGENAYWQVMPHIGNENARTEPFLVKRARFGSSDIQVVHESLGRATAPLYACSDGVAATPRIDSGARYWELVHIPESAQGATDRITLPNNMQPAAVAWGATGFAFCFDSIYDYGDGISNLGTYTPSAASDQAGSGQWFRFGRTPLSSPAWCGQQWLLVKSTHAVCAVDLQAREYCALDIDDASDDWGDYLATSGIHSTFVTFAHLNGIDSTGAEVRRTQVRVWEPNSAEERATLEAEALAAQDEEATIA